jgi:hypothetical protein
MYSRLFGKEPEFNVPHTDDELVRLAVLKKKLNGQRVVCNMTTIPPRFGHVQNIIDILKTHHIFDDIVVHVPRKYKRFGDFKGPYPDFATLCDEDYGPATRILNAQGDIVVYCDDDTEYSHRTSLELIEKHIETQGCCGGSGFNFSKYFIGDFSKNVGESVQVIEGYGMVVCKREWIERVSNEFKTLLEHTYNDDMIFSNLLERYTIKKFVFPSEIKQLEYGFDKDALHWNNGEKSHMSNNKRILNTLRKHGKMYFKPTVSYAICVCDESRELGDLLHVLDSSILHSDEIVILVDTTKVTQSVFDILQKYPWIAVHQREFTGNFANHKNFLTSVCKGRHVFNIDADEIPSHFLIENMYKLLEFDLVYVPRVNILPGASPEYLKKHNFTVSKEGYINYPDYQGRIFSSHLLWESSLHEHIVGAKKITQIQADPNLSLWHIKSLTKMDAQNDLYQTLSKNVR